ncbi:unnamed protein product [Phaedon cochleariae]|uniref:DUF4806 domain-containing protein n=1 Tax=Phaedon cochleariae TaxID=80249 RepID=A0A9N9SM55_PHACE|nr:unnamed protein product [Phaedon cochleariae]
MQLKNWLNPFGPLMQKLPQPHQVAPLPICAITQSSPTSLDDERTFGRIINEAPIIIETTTTEEMTDMNQILQTLLNISGRLEIMENRMGNMEQVLNTSFSVNPQRSQNNISKLLPVKSIHELQELEQKLEDDNNKQQLLQVLQFIGGLNEKSCVERSLERFFTNHCAMFCSWTGKKVNFKIKDLKSIQILKDAVRNSFPCIKDDAFERNVMAWLQLNRLFVKGCKSPNDVKLDYDEFLFSEDISFIY